MIEYSFENLEEKYQSLPADIQEAISSVQIANQLEEIGKKYNLHVDQMGELHDETGLVMLGLTHPKDYIRNIERRLAVPIEDARKIAQDVNEQIFRPIRESLKKIHEVGEYEPSSSGAKGGEKVAVGQQADDAAPPENLPIRETQDKPAKEEQSLLPLRKPDEVELKEVEYPPRYANIVEEKMKGTFHIPREKSEHAVSLSEKLGERKPETPVKEFQKSKGEYGEADPYREPLE